MDFRCPSWHGVSVTADDPAYRFEFDRMAELCRTFQKAHEEENSMMMLLTCGMILGQCANIYKLSPPGGILDPADLFRRDES